MNRIEHIIEPDRLLLTWQGPDLQGDRTRRLVGEIVPGPGDRQTLRYLCDTDDFQEAVELGFSSYPAFPLTETEYQGDILAAFLRRVPPRSRKDSADFLRLHAVPDSAGMSDMALLAYTGARLPSDDFALLHPFADAPVPCELVTEVAGFRHYRESLKSQPQVGQRIELAPDDGNQFDKAAVEVRLEGERIGYINRFYAPSFRIWLQSSELASVVHHVNGPAFRPMVLIFVQVKPPAAADGVGRAA